MKYLKYFEGYAFQISTEDVILAIEQEFGATISEQEAEEIYGDLDHVKIESAALSVGTDNDDDQMDAQLNAALEEIINQVKTMDSELIRRLLTQKRFDL